MKAYKLQYINMPSNIRLFDNQGWKSVKSDPAFEKDENGFLFLQESKDLLFKTAADADLYRSTLKNTDHLLFRIEEVEEEKE